MSDLRKAAEMALKVLCVGNNEVVPYNHDKVVNEAIRRLQDALFNQSKLEWFPAPTKVEWGEDMICAAVDIDDNHYFDVYCERWQKENVELILGFSKREWQGLTDDELQEINNWKWANSVEYAKTIESKLKEKNT